MIVLATPTWDRACGLIANALRNEGPLSAVRTVERLRGLSPALKGELLEAQSAVWVLKSRLHVVVYRGLTSEHGDPGSVEVHGVTSRRVITDAGVAFLVDAWQNSLELEIMKYHGIGTGSTAEAASQTALVTELSTQYNNSGDVRATGSLTESSAPVFVTVGTNTVDATVSVAEHGIFTVATPSSGTMWDRSLTGTQALSSGDSLQTTYSLTVSSGG